MAVTHKNRKGKIYYLHQQKTKTGRPRYFFALREEGDLVESIPEGYEIYENPKGQVYLRRVRPQLITDEELAIVEAGMKRYSSLQQYIVDVKKDTIILYTADQDIDLLADTFQGFPGVDKKRAQEALQRVLSFSPVLQFVLVDKEKRLFHTRRLSSRGPTEDWISIGKRDELSTLVAEYIPHLGQNSYYLL